MKFVFALFIVLCSSDSFAQAKKFSLTGFVQDEASSAVPYATILIYSLPDSVLKDGTVTLENGSFKVELEPGNYFLKIRFLSFDELIISEVNIIDKSFDLGVVRLKQKDAVLDAVDVTVEKPQMELKLDKRIFNIQKDMSNIGLNAADILDNIPSISVDAEGNVSLRGSQNVRILINGKPSTLTGMSNADALRQINGSMIESVEVITNPSARYDAEGEVGIINIVLKKELQKGFNGSLNARVGYPLGYGAGFNLNYRSKRINYFGGYSLGVQRSPGTGYNYQTFDGPDTSYRYEQISSHERGGFSHNFNGGIDLSITPKMALTFSGTFQFSEGDNWNKIVYNDFDIDGNNTQIVNRDEVESDYGNSQEYNVNFRKTFDLKDRLWTVDFKKSYSLDNERSDLIQISNQVWGQNMVQRTTNGEHENTWLFQTDYIHPLGKEGKFETGAKVNLRTLYSDYLLEDSLDNFWQTNSLFDNQLLYTENIYAGYVMVGNKSKKFSYQGGLRIEYSDVTTNLVKTEQVNHRQYSRLFPSFHFSYELKNNNFLQLSYSRRISRPRYWWLTPFYTFRDSRNYESGNPNINPEFAGSYELGHLKYWKKGSVLTSLYYRHTIDVMERILTTDSLGITWRTPVNLGDRNSFGIEFSGSYELFEWWNLNGSINFYRSISKGSYDGVNYVNDAYAWSGKLTTKFNVNRKISIQSSVNYDSPTSTYQGSAKGQFVWDGSASVDLLKGNATLSFNGRDLLNSRKRRSVVQTGYLTSESFFQWRSRQLTLNFVYRINQKKGKGDRSDFGGVDGDM